MPGATYGSVTLGLLTGSTVSGIDVRQCLNGTQLLAAIGLIRRTGPDRYSCDKFTHLPSWCSLLDAMQGHRSHVIRVSLHVLSSTLGR